MGIIIVCIIFVVFVLVVVNMLFFFVFVWIFVYGGIFFFGFGGVWWILDMVINYFKMVFGVVVLLMVMVFLVGIGKMFVD